MKNGMGDDMTREAYLSQMLTTYSLVKVLANKNGGKVLQLRHNQQGRSLVVRSFDQKVVAYRRLCDLSCENLPLIYDVIDADDGQLVLEEYIEGLTVTQVMEVGRYRYRGVKRVLQGLLNGLSVLHDRGLIHRDVKPDNIMVTPNGRVVLVDFNATREISTASQDTVVMGTVGYASPEQLGVTQSDARTDLYAVGILLNVMLTGKHPSEQMATGKAGKIVRKCTAVNPNERYQTAQNLADAL